MKVQLWGSALALVMAAGCDEPPCANANCASEGEGEGEGDRDAVSIAPALCDFGEVAVGGTGECVVTIQNPGTADVLIASLSVAEDTGVFWSGDGTPVPLRIRPDERVDIRLVAIPTAIGVVRDTFVAEGYQGEVLAVPLRVQGIARTTCVARIVSVNGVPVTGDAPRVEIGDTVVISGDESQTSPDHSIVAAQWEFEALPPGTRAAITDSSALTTTFSTDMPGTYAIGLTVTNDLGEAASCDLTIPVAPPTTLFVQMVHDTAGSDVDLHLLRHDGDWCSVDDCHAGNPTPGWATFSANPGEGIVVEDVVDGRYVVGVDHVVGTTQVVVRVFFAGALQHEATSGLDGGQWLPVQLDVTDGVPTFTTLDDVTPQVGACLQD